MKSMTYKIIMMALALTAGSLVRAMQPNKMLIDSMIDVHCRLMHETLSTAASSASTAFANFGGGGADEGIIRRYPCGTYHGTYAKASIWNRLRYQTGRFFNGVYNAIANNSFFAKATACVATLAVLYMARSTGTKLPILGLGSMSIHRA